METNFPNMEHSQSKAARERIVADLQALIHDSEALLRATADDISVKAKEQRARMADALARAKATCSEFTKDGIASARDAAQKADDTIRTHPYESMAIAFGVGVLLGAILRRR